MDGGKAHIVKYINASVDPVLAKIASSASLQITVQNLLGGLSDFFKPFLIIQFSVCRYQAPWSPISKKPPTLSSPVLTATWDTPLTPSSFLTLLGIASTAFCTLFSFQTCQQPMPMMATSPTLSMDSDFTFNTAYATPSPPPDFSPVPSEQFEFALSPSSVTTSPSSPPKELEVDSWGPSDLHQMGYLDVAGNWRCRYAGCCSSRVFLRACDLRKHFRGHAKYFFCTEKRCQQAGVGFATRKDFQRHMGSHKPAVRCLHPDCDRIFSRKDNMREHYKKIHQRLRNNLFPRRCRKTTQSEPQQAVSPASTCSSCTMDS